MSHFPENLILSPEFPIRTSFSVRYYLITFSFLSFLPHDFVLSFIFYLRLFFSSRFDLTAFNFMSHFCLSTSNSPSLPLYVIISLRFFLWIFYFVSFHLRTATFCQILPLNFHLSVIFTSESYFCQIVPQYPLLSNRFYLRTPLFLLDFTLKPPTFCWTLPQNFFMSGFT